MCHLVIIGVINSNRSISLMDELMPFSPPAWERTMGHKTTLICGRAVYVYPQRCSRVQLVNCDYRLFLWFHVILMSLSSLYNDNTTAHFKFKLCIIFHQYVINIKANARYASRVRATAPIFDCEQLLVIQSKSYEVEKLGFEPGLLHYMPSAPTVELRECDTSNLWFGILVWVI